MMSLSLNVTAELACSIHYLSTEAAIIDKLSKSK
jgi:hypothetical protein